MTAATDRAERALERAAIRARKQGRSVLLEPDLLPALEALGFGVPRWRVVDSAEATLPLADLPGSKVVVKLISPKLPHRTEIDGVRVVPREAGAVRDALRSLDAVSPDESARFLLEEWVEHDTAPGGELLLGARWTEDFGPVVTLGLGGIASEALAEAGGLVHLFSPLTEAAEAPGERLEHHPLAALATGAVRSRQPRLARPALVSHLQAFGALAAGVMPGLLLELEINPLVVRDGRAVAVDALARLAPLDTRDVPSAPPVLSSARAAGMQRILSPESVAVIGVSTRMNPGRIIVRNLLEGGFPPERLVIVKPGSESLAGCRCVEDVDALDPPVDLLVVAVAAAEVPALLERVVSGRRARSVVLIPGGLGEAGTDHRAEQLRRALAAAGDDRPVLHGGNCLGVRSVPGRCDTLFIPGEKLGFPDTPPHPVALVTQSGAFAIARASRHPWLNPRHIVTVGNQIDLTLGEYVEALVEDTETRVVACYVEGFRPLDGARLARAAAVLRGQGRLLVLYRGGRTRQGADAAVSHTASVAGDYAVTRALIEQAGGVVAQSLEAFDDLLMVGTLLAGRRVGGSGLGALSNAGFECVTMADAAGTLPLPDLSGQTLATVGTLLERHRLQGVVSPRNPLDLTPILGDAAYVEAAALLLADPRVHVGAIGCVPLTPALQTLEAGNGLEEDVTVASGVLSGLAGLWRTTDKAWVAVVDGGGRYDAFARGLARAGIPTFRRADAAVSTLARYVEWRLGGVA